MSTIDDATIIPLETDDDIISLPWLQLLRVRSLLRDLRKNLVDIVNFFGRPTDGLDFIKFIQLVLPTPFAVIELRRILFV